MKSSVPASCSSSRATVSAQAMTAPRHLQLLDSHLPVLFAAGADRIHGNMDRKASLKEIERGLEDADMGLYAGEDDRLPAQLRGVRQNEC